MKKWEYKQVCCDPHLSTVDFLNEQGEQGWELVEVLFNDVSAYFIFKREKLPPLGGGLGEK